MQPLSWLVSLVLVAPISPIWGARVAQEDGVSNLYDDVDEDGAFLETALTASSNSYQRPELVQGGMDVVTKAAAAYRSGSAADIGNSLISAAGLAVLAIPLPFNMLVGGVLGISGGLLSSFGPGAAHQPTNQDIVDTMTANFNEIHVELAEMRNVLRNQRNQFRDALDMAKVHEVESSYRAYMRRLNSAFQNSSSMPDVGTYLEGIFISLSHHEDGVFRPMEVEAILGRTLDCSEKHNTYLRILVARFYLFTMLFHRQLNEHNGIDQIAMDEAALLRQHMEAYQGIVDDLHVPLTSQDLSDCAQSLEKTWSQVTDNAGNLPRTGRTRDVFFHPDTSSETYDQTVEPTAFDRDFMYGMVGDGSGFERDGLVYRAPKPHRPPDGRGYWVLAHQNAQSLSRAEHLSSGDCLPLFQGLRGRWFYAVSAHAVWRLPKSGSSVRWRRTARLHAPWQSQELRWCRDQWNAAPLAMDHDHIYRVGSEAFDTSPPSVRRRRSDSSIFSELTTIHRRRRTRTGRVNACPHCPNCMIGAGANCPLLFETFLMRVPKKGGDWRRIEGSPVFTGQEAWTGRHMPSDPGVRQLAVDDAYIYGMTSRPHDGMTSRPHDGKSLWRMSKSSWRYQFYELPSQQESARHHFTIDDFYLYVYGSLEGIWRTPKAWESWTLLESVAPAMLIDIPWATIQRTQYLVTLSADNGWLYAGIRNFENFDDPTARQRRGLSVEVFRVSGNSDDWWNTPRVHISRLQSLPRNATWSSSHGQW